MRDINTVGNKLMKLIILGHPPLLTSLPPLPQNCPISGVTMMLTEVCQLSHWLGFKCAFENHSTVGNQALADKACYHTVFRAALGNGSLSAPYLPEICGANSASCRWRQEAAWGPSFLLNKKGKGIVVATLWVPGFKEGLYLMSRSKHVITCAPSL